MGSHMTLVQEEMELHLENTHVLIRECYEILHKMEVRLRIQPELELASAEVRMDETLCAFKTEKERILGLKPFIRKKLAIKRIISAQNACFKTCGHIIDAVRAVEFFSVDSNRINHMPPHFNFEEYIHEKNLAVVLAESMEGTLRSALEEGIAAETISGPLSTNRLNSMNRKAESIINHVIYKREQAIIGMVVDGEKKQLATWKY